MRMFESLESRTLLSFSAPITTSGAGDSLVVAKFNSDNYADVAVLEGAKVSVRLSNGDGTFGKGPTLSGTVGVPYSLAAGDFNADGRADLRAFAVSTTKKGGTGIRTGNETTWLGNGDGTFGAASIYSYSWPYGGIPDPYNPPSASADFNGDGLGDGVGIDGAPGSVYVNISNPDGSYQNLSFAAGKAPGAVGAGDFNGDGRIDIVVVNSVTSLYALGKGIETFSVLLNDGNW